MGCPDILAMVRHLGSLGISCHRRNHELVMMHHQSLLINSKVLGVKSGNILNAHGRDAIMSIAHGLYSSVVILKRSQVVRSARRVLAIPA